MLIPFGEWVTGLAKKIKSKIAVKIFLGVFGVLSITFAMSFFLFSIMLPQTFEREFESRFNDFLGEFVTIFQTTPEYELKEPVERFGANSGVNIIIYDEWENIAYSHTSFNLEYIDSADFLMSNRFGMGSSDADRSYSGYAIASLAVVRQVTELLGGILPFALAFSLIMSLLVSALFSRNLAKPIVALSEMSRKMSQIDLSNRCDIVIQPKKTLFQNTNKFHPV